MFKCLKILIALLGLYTASLAQGPGSGVSNGVEDILWDKDSVWIINTGYDIYTPKYDLSLKLPAYLGGTYYYTIDKGDGSGVSTKKTLPATERSLYEDAKIYTITIKLYDDPLAIIPVKTVVRLVMNRGLTTDFELTPLPFKYCLEWGGDSLLLVLKDYKNPKGTVYDIVFDSKASNIAGLADSLAKYTWFGPAKDSAWIEFLQPTGTYDCKISVRMTYQDPEKRIDMEAETDARKVSVYAAPDIKKIFNFADTIPTGEELKNFEVCTNVGQDILQMDASVLMLYQYKPENISAYPYYLSLHNNKNFTIDYFYTEDPVAGSWEKVTNKSDYVDTTGNIGFHKGGFYKLMITADNKCNYNPETLKFKADTLWSDSVKNNNKKRYFQVSETNPNNIFCLNDTLCTNLAKTITLVDRNVRKKHDAPPSYVLTIREQDDADKIWNDEEYKVIQKIYKDGAILSGDINEKGCDSTVIEVTLVKEIRGWLDVALNRSSACGDLERTFPIHVGRNPQAINRDTLNITLEKVYGFTWEGNLQKCDSFKYQLQENLWNLCSFNRDSLFFYFNKGSKKDTVDFLKRTEDFHIFDSTGNTLSYIQIRAKNYCGWSDPIATEFYTRTRPDVILQRDGLEKNDTLCIGFDYPYSFGGILPENYKVTMQADNDTWINGSKHAAGETISLDNWQTQEPVVSHKTAGKVLEKFWIQNSDMPSCAQELDTMIYLIPAPDTVAYRDSIHYCNSLTSINTKKLFHKDKDVFKYADWKLNTGINIRQNFPVIDLTGVPVVDTIHYKLFNSKGCYVSGKILTRPDTQPQLKLSDRAQRCLPDTIKGLKVASDIVIDLSIDSKYKLEVFHSTINATNLLFKDGMKDQIILGDFLDKKNLIYVLKNSNTDTAFMDKCRTTDTVRLSLSTPKIDIKGTLRLDYPWTKVDFKRLKTPSIIDTADIQPVSISWKYLPGGVEVSGTGLYDREYVLQTADEKAMDSLLFKLSANSLCGEQITDTLVVYLTHPQLKAYKDTICSNTEKYVLWNKVVAENLDESTLKWKMCFPNDPAQTGLVVNGTNTVYTPALGVDSVRIAVEGQLLGIPSVTTKDTIVLIVNPAPRLKFMVDTLWACNRQIVLNNLSPTYIDTLNCASLKKGDYVSSGPGSTNIGAWSGNNYTFRGLELGNFVENLAQKVSYQALGLPGCKAALDTVTLVDPVYANVHFKRNLEEMCAGKELKLDTIYDIEGEDQHTRLQWILTTLDVGHFDTDTSHYIAHQPEDKVQKIQLTTYKSYTCYTGTSSGKVLETTPVELPIIVHREPVFQVSHRYDTLCREDNEIHIDRSRVVVKPGLYPNYQDSLKINGRPFTAAGIDYVIAKEGQQDTLIVSVSQGMCSEWALHSDTIFLFRLPDMITNRVVLPDICEGGEMILPQAKTLVSGLAGKAQWTATGGTLTSENPPHFRPDVGESAPTLTLEATSPKIGCSVDKYTQSIHIFGRPQMDLMPDTICKVIGQTLTVTPAISGENLMIDKIEWFRAGEEGNILKQSVSPDESWIFTLIDADVVSGKVELVEKVTMSGVCMGTYYDTLYIALQEKPVVNVNTGIALCQGSSLDLQSELQITNSGNTLLTLQSTTPGSMAGTIYTPAEHFFGTANFILKTEGLYGCAAVTRNFSVEVKAAPLPLLNVTGLLCQKDTVVCKAQNLPGGIKADCSWSFGDGKTAVGVNVKHVYAASGNYQIALDVAYNTGCNREVTRDLVINPKPQAVFNLPSQVGVNKLINLVSTSLPADVNCLWTTNDGGNYNTSSCVHKFTGSMGNRTVALRVTTALGCWDTVSHTTLAVIPPVPKFTVLVDSCLGKVNIANISDSNYAQVIAWDFANGTSLSNIWDPVQQNYDRVYRDTVYKISLTLKNAGGEATYTVPVKMISRLKAGVDVLEPSEPCNKLEKEIRILTQGKADTTQIWWGDGTMQKWDNLFVQTVKHRYKNDTTIVLYYPLVVAVKNACEEDITNPVSVRVYPVAVKASIALDTTYKEECYGYDRGFINKSFGFMAEGYTAEWQFEKDITTNTGKKVKYLFEKPGTYTVRLRMKDNCNQDIDSVKVIVHGNDSLDFKWNEKLLCTGKDITFQFVPHGDEPFGDFKWEFSDGIKRDGREVHYSFPDNGDQMVKLTAVADGCKSTMSHSLKVHRSPKPIISVRDNPTFGCTPLHIPFYGANGNDENSTALWNFKDNSFSDLFIVEDKVFEKAGDYNVIFSLTTDAGCVDSVALLINALYTPEAKLSLGQNLFCSKNGNFEVTAVNNTVNSENSTFEWWKDDERISFASDSVKLNYSNFFGKSAVKLKAIHKTSHCAVAIEDTLVSAHQVVANLTVEPSDVCAGTPVVFTNTSEFAGGEMKLALGDGTFIETNGRFEYIYENSNAYTVKLRVTGPEGCYDSMEMPLNVYALPEAGFTWTKDNSVLGLVPGVGQENRDNGGIRFKNESVFNPLAIENPDLKFCWKFDDQSAPDYHENPVHVFPNNGNYEVWLYVQSVKGCLDSISDVVNIATVKGLYMPNAFAPAVVDEGVNRFQPKGVGLHSYNIKIYAGDGTCVWKSQVLDDGRPAEYWDGSIGGRPLPKGVYIWEVSAVFIDGTVWDKVNGSVMLIR